MQRAPRFYIHAETPRYRRDEDTVLAAHGSAEPLINGMDDVLAKDGHPDCLGSWIAAATIANAILDRGLHEERATKSSLDSSSNEAKECPVPPDYVMKEIIYAANEDRATR